MKKALGRESADSESVVTHLQWGANHNEVVKVRVFEWMSTRGVMSRTFSVANGCTCSARMNVNAITSISVYWQNKWMGNAPSTRCQSQWGGRRCADRAGDSNGTSPGGPRRRIRCRAAASAQARSNVICWIVIRMVLDCAKNGVGLC